MSTKILHGYHLSKAIIKRPKYIQNIHRFTYITKDMLKVLQMPRQPYFSTISFPLEPLVEPGTFEYSRDIVQLEDESSSENSKIVYINA